MGKRKKRNIIYPLIVLILISAGGYYFYQKFFTPVRFKDKNHTYIFIGHDMQLDDLVEELEDKEVIKDEESFMWLAKRMELDSNIHPGKYRINNGMTIRQIINMIKYNRQEKVRLTFNSQIRNLDEFVEYVDEKLEINADVIEDLISDEKMLKDYFGLDPGNAFAMIIPGVMEVSWAITADDFFTGLKDRYNKIWNDSRLKQAKKIGFTPAEVMTIASIVQSESSIKSEQEKIAGVYINRLKADMLLQADPTLKFASRNYDLQRLLDSDKEINSPYNTYLYKGLPPGPICLVSVQAIDATLNYRRHNYIFFCARPELNGYSDFSTTYDQHRKYAAAYQKALDKMGISR
jgi:UPF0755 protein